MEYYLTGDEIDEIGEGLIRKYQYQTLIEGKPVDIEGFLTGNLGYRIVYDRLAERDAGRMAFLADGKAALRVWRAGRRLSVVPPKGTVVVDESLYQTQNAKKRRFVLAHEAGHIIMDRLGNNPVSAAFRQEFDREQTYTVEEFASMFSITEGMATSMGVALLMPKNVVIHYIRDMTNGKRIPLYGNSVLSDRDRNVVGRTAERFQVSYKSMFYRLRDLKLFEARDLDEYFAGFGGIGGAV